jgi:hypothetical protein
MRVHLFSLEWVIITISPGATIKSANSAMKMTRPESSPKLTRLLMEENTKKKKPEQRTIEVKSMARPVV